MMKSLLEAIQSSLESNQEIVMGKKQVYDMFPSKRFSEKSYRSSQRTAPQTVLFSVAPKTPLYRISELNDFKDSLLSGLGQQPNANVGFQWLTEDSIKLGQLLYSETIATGHEHYGRSIKISIFPNKLFLGYYNDGKIEDKFIPDTFLSKKHSEIINEILVSNEDSKPKRFR